MVSGEPGWCVGRESRGHGPDEARQAHELVPAASQLADGAAAGMEHPDGIEDRGLSVELGQAPEGERPDRGVGSGQQRGRELTVASPTAGGCDGR